MEKRKRQSYSQNIQGVAALGKEIKISPKSHVIVNSEGFQRKYYSKSIEVLIGIGNDNTASLIMDEEAWEALLAGEEITIDTAKEFAAKLRKKVSK
jgi:hypothetical protein